MDRQSSKMKFIYWGALIVLIWLGIRGLDPTSSARFVSDSPDGKYRCCMFEKIAFGGDNDYAFGLFEGRWPHRELAGDRAQRQGDSVSCSDFRTTWNADTVEVDFKTGYGDDRRQFTGRIVNGRQEWQ